MEVHFQNHSVVLVEIITYTFELWNRYKQKAQAVKAPAATVVIVTFPHLFSDFLQWFWLSANFSEEVLLSLTTVTHRSTRDQ